MSTDRLKRAKQVFSQLAANNLVTYEMMDAMEGPNEFRIGMPLADVNGILVRMDRQRRSWLVSQLEALEELRAETAVVT